jgi:hypothetical protein
MSVIIEKSIPLPARNAARRKPKYPWAEMRIGDSILIDLPFTSVSSMASKAGAKLGFKFECRKMADGTRVWRTC